MLDHLRATENYEPDLVVFLQATSPLCSGDVQAAIDLLGASGATRSFPQHPCTAFLAEP